MIFDISRRNDFLYPEIIDKKVVISITIEYKILFVGDSSFSLRQISEESYSINSLNKPQIEEKSVVSISIYNDQVTYILEDGSRILEEREDTSEPINGYDLYIFARPHNF